MIWSGKGASSLDGSFFADKAGRSITFLVEQCSASRVWTFHDWQVQVGASRSKKASVVTPFVYAPSPASHSSREGARAIVKIRFPKTTPHGPCHFCPVVAPLRINYQSKVLRRGGGNVKGPRAVYVRQEGISPFSCLFIIVARSEISTLWFPEGPDGILECLLSCFLIQNGFEIQGQRYWRRPELQRKLGQLGAHNRGVQYVDCFLICCCVVICAFVSELRDH